MTTPNITYRRRPWWAFLFNPRHPGAWMAWLLGTLILLSVYEATLMRACLARGYPEVRWMPLGTTYCVRREEQTDRVVPLHTLP